MWLKVKNSANSAAHRERADERGAERGEIPAPASKPAGLLDTKPGRTALERLFQGGSRALILDV